MAAITQTNALDQGVPVNITRTVLSASDTLTYFAGSKQQLFLFNTTASPVTVTLVGSGATTISPAGYGGTISVAAGKAIVVPASGSTLVDLDDISAYLVGNVTVTGGTGVTAHLYV
jgi:hypothetical protein